MLTKQEREATIERIKSYGDSDLPFYKLLFGSRAPYAMQYTEYLKALKDRVIDLCDTSNMIELPVDKDGEVIRVGDVVYGEDGLRHEVYQIVFDGDAKWLVLDRDGELSVGTYSSPISFTNKQPVTAKSLAQRIRDVLRNDHSEMSPYTSRELVHIANDLERLGDNNE